MVPTTFTAELTVDELVLYDDREVAEFLLEQYISVVELPEEDEDSVIGLVDTLVYRAVSFDEATQMLTFSCTIDIPEETLLLWDADETLEGEEAEMSADVAAGVLLAERVLMG